MKLSSLKILWDCVYDDGLNSTWLHYQATHLINVTIRKRCIRCVMLYRAETVLAYESRDVRRRLERRRQDKLLHMDLVEEKVPVVPDLRSRLSRPNY